MVSLKANNFMVFNQSFSYLNSSKMFPIISVICPLKKRYSLRQKLKEKKQNKSFFEFSTCGVVSMCKKWEGDEEGDQVLELEMLEFMNNSKNPKKFPSKKDLIQAGRVDLVEGILKNGGWMSMGWDEDEQIEDGFCKNLEEDGVSSSGQTIELAAEDSGIEGILNRLKRERYLSLGVSSRKNGSSKDFFQEGQCGSTSKDVDSCHPERSRSASSSNGGHVRHDNGSSRHYTSPSSSHKEDTWRTWSIQRAGFSNTVFEAAEIDYVRNTKESTVSTAMDSIIADTNNVHKPSDNTMDSNSSVQGISQIDVKTRLQILKGELSSVLGSVRTNTADLSEKADEDMPEDFRQLSDASEFQENEMMHAQDKLRSMRAKLAILEGKMTLAINDAEKILDEKQKRIDDARRALQLLRNTCIVWPNAGSEVLLAGSFDGWATQRKMERSSSGIFSLNLKLYPGKYEIKFIVDGSWKVDPLRPIVNHSGYENNILIID